MPERVKPRFVFCSSLFFFEIGSLVVSLRDALFRKNMLLLELLDGKEGIRGKKVVGSDGVATEMFSVYDFIMWKKNTR